MKSENFIVSAFFLLSLIVGACFGLFGAVDSKNSAYISWQENRTLASFPRIKSVRRDLPGFPILFEKFYNDHFLFRLPLSLLRNQIEYEALQTSGSSSVAIGQNHWLFYALDKLPIVQQNLEAYEKPELENALNIFRARRDMLSQHGIKYFVLFAPEKGTIYQNLMPTGWTRKAQPSRLEQLQTVFREEKIEFVDARAVLTESATKHKLYFSDDSHWNRYGALLVANQLFSQLHNKFAVIKPYTEKDYTLHDDNHKGDLSLVLGVQKIIDEEGNQFADPVEKRAHEVRNKALPRFESGVVEIVNEPRAYQVDDATLPRAFFFHDSFMEFLKPYLVEKFSFSEFHPGEMFAPEMVVAEKPDVVVEEIAERHLYDHGFENFPTFINALSINASSVNASLTTDKSVCSFQKKWQLLSVKPERFEHSIGVKLHWRALVDAKLDDRVQLSLLDAKTKEVKTSLEYKQDAMIRAVKAGQEWIDFVPLKIFSDTKFDQIGVIVSGGAGALYCEAPHCDYNVRAVFDLNQGK